MIRVCIPYTNHSNMLKQWDFVLSNFQVDEVIIWDKHNRYESLDSANFKNATLITSLDALPNETQVVLTPLNARYVQGNENLMTFNHPTNCIYIVGSDNEHMQLEDVANCDHYVYVPCDNNIEMYSWVAYACAMYDRKLKANG